MPHSSHELAPMLRKLMRSSGLDLADQQAIKDLPFTYRSVGRGNYIVREGDRVDHCSLLLSGFAYRQKTVADGGRQVLSVHMPGEFVDLQNAVLPTSDHNVQALTDVHLARVPRQAIMEVIAARPAVANALWHDTLVDSSIHREWTVNVGRRSARMRMSHLLCELGVRMRDAGLGLLCQYDLPMTQEEFADALGLTSVHVNRTLKGLSLDGLVDKKRHSVAIHDWPQLAAAGDFNSRYLHLREDQYVN